MGKIFLGLVLILVLAGGWYYWNAEPAALAPTQQSAETEQMPTAPAPAPVTDASLEADAAVLDTEIQTASAEVGAAGSFTDTPITQTE